MKIRIACTSLAVTLLLPALAAIAQIQPKGDSPLEKRAFRHPDLYVRQHGKA